MCTIVVHQKAKNKFLLVIQLPEKLGSDVKIISYKDKENSAFSLMMA